MKISRRDFIRSLFILGGSLMLFPGRFARDAGAREGFHPAYGDLEIAGELKARVEEACSILGECRLCPRQCGANRQKGELGFCRAPKRVMVAASSAHFGEEVSLVGDEGSGTIFFSNCNLRCVFCQNWPIAHKGMGEELGDEELADVMLRLQEMGCHNINLVTPTHVMPHILAAVRIAYKRGLRLPLVYNTSGYERVEMLRLLDGVVDIYLPDMKYMDPEKAETYSSGASDYPKVAKEAVLEMHRQVGEHTVDERGVALRGLMIRHLVMPNRVADTGDFVGWVARNLPRSTYVNIMHQYHVEYKAFDYPEIARAITVDEYLEAMAWAEECGLTNLDPRSLTVRDIYRQMKAGKESLGL